MEKTTRMTNKMALQYALNAIGDSNAEVSEKLTKMIEQLDKKNASPKKMTAKQEQNEVVKAEILNFLTENEGKGFTVTEMLKSIEILSGDSNQHASALLRALTLDGKVERYTDKRKTYFKVK